MKIDIPYGNDFELLIPCDPQIEGCLSFQLDAEGATMLIKAVDDKGSSLVFIDKESQALMIIAAMKAFIRKIREIERENRSPK